MRPLRIDDTVMTPEGRGVIVGYDVDKNEFRVNLLEKPGSGPYRYNAKRLRLLDFDKE